MQNKIEWEEGTAVTAEDIVASLKPLVDEYFVARAGWRAKRFSTPSPTAERSL